VAAPEEAGADDGGAAATAPRPCPNFPSWSISALPAFGDLLSPLVIVLPSSIDVLVASNGPFTCSWMLLLVLGVDIDCGQCVCVRFMRWT